MKASEVLGRDRFTARVGTCRQRLKLPLTRTVCPVASSGTAENFKQPADIQMPNGVFWLDKSAHKHDVVYGQVGFISVHLSTLADIETLQSRL